MNTQVLLGVLALVATAVFAHLLYHFLPVQGNLLHHIMAAGRYFTSVGVFEVGMVAAIGSAILFSMGIVALLFETAA